MKLSQHKNSELTDICDTADYITEVRKRWKRKKVESKRKVGRWQGIKAGRCAPVKNPLPQGSKHLIIIIITLTTLKSLIKQMLHM